MASLELPYMGSTGEQSCDILDGRFSCPKIGPSYPYQILIDVEVVPMLFWTCFVRWKLLQLNECPVSE